MVQRRYARYLKKDFQQTSSVTAMLRDIGWDSLEERRAKSRSDMIYRIKNDMLDVPASEYLTPLHGNTKSTRRVPSTIRPD